jgi:hypothetical protein
MKNYLFKFNSSYLFIAAAMVSVSLLFGCSPPNQSQIAGSYVRYNQGVTDTILLDGNGTFKQDIIYTNGGSWSSIGSWKIINRVIRLDKCYLTFDDEKQSIIIPPQIVYMCTFSFDSEKLIRTELQPPWVKTSPTK